MSRKVSITIYLEPGSKRALKALSDHTMVPAAEYVRMGIDAILDQATWQEYECQGSCRGQGVYVNEDGDTVVCGECGGLGKHYELLKPPPLRRTS